VILGRRAPEWAVEGGGGRGDSCAFWLGAWTPDARRQTPALSERKGSSQRGRGAGREKEKASDPRLRNGEGTGINSCEIASDDPVG
jgi:hypothetical protein